MSCFVYDLKFKIAGIFQDYINYAGMKKWNIKLDHRSICNTCVSEIELDGDSDIDIIRIISYHKIQ